MNTRHFIDDIARRLSELAAKTPAADFEKNAKALLSGLLTKVNLVTREEFDLQTQVLARTREKLQLLEARVNEWENRRQP